MDEENRGRNISTHVLSTMKQAMRDHALDLSESPTPVEDLKISVQLAQEAYKQIPGGVVIAMAGLRKVAEVLKLDFPE